MTDCITHVEVELDYRTLLYQIEPNAIINFAQLTNGRTCFHVIIDRSTVRIYWPSDGARVMATSGMSMIEVKENVNTSKTST